MMHKWAAMVLASASLGMASTALAAQPLAMEDGASWTHKETGLKVPASAAGLKRAKGVDLGATQSDVNFTYYDAETQTTVTLYFTRAGFPDAAIWGDRANAIIVQVAPQNYGKLDLAGRKWSLFTPWSNSPNSGMRVVYSVSGKGVTATGLSMMAHGDWLIKVRMTSNRIDMARLDQMLAEFVADLELPAPKLPSNPVYEVKPCANALPGKEAKLLEAGGNSNVMAGALGNSVMGLDDPSKPKQRRPAVVYCRDSASQAMFGVYRANGSTSEYAMALGDAGNTILVGPDAGMLLIDPQSKAYSATAMTSEKVFGFVPYQSMPSPKQIFEGLNRMRPTYMRSRVPGQEKEIQVFM